MSLAGDMAQAERVLRSGVIRERRLCCPHCSGRIELMAGLLVCEGIEDLQLCGFTCHTLAELAEVAA